MAQRGKEDLERNTQPISLPPRVVLLKRLCWILSLIRDRKQLALLTPVWEQE